MYSNMHFDIASFFNCHSIYWHIYFDHVRKKAAAMKHLHNTCTFYEQKILSSSRKLNKTRKRCSFRSNLVLHNLSLYTLYAQLVFLKAFYLSDTWLLTASGSIWQSQPHACSRSTVTRSSNPSGNIAKELFLSSGHVFRLDWMEASKVSYVINKVFFSKDDIRRPGAHYIIHQIFMYFLFNKDSHIFFEYFSI